MATVVGLYTAPISVTITLASLASSSGLTSGRAGTAIDLASLASGTVPLDMMLAGTIMTGTSPTAGVIQVWLAGSIDNTVWSGNLPSTNGAATPVPIGGGLALAATMLTTATSNQAYPFLTRSLGAIFGGGWAPRYVNVFVTHNTVAALNATGGNHSISLGQWNVAQ